MLISDEIWAIKSWSTQSHFSKVGIDVFDQIIENHNSTYQYYDFYGSYIAIVEPTKYLISYSQ